MNELAVLIVKIVLGAIALTIYLNIGWAIGTYYHYIFGQKPETFWQKFWSGGLNLWSIQSTEPTFSKKFDQISMSIAWPIFLVVVVMSWIVYLIYVLLRLICNILWLIFAGGIAKLLKIG